MNNSLLGKVKYEIEGLKFLIRNMKATRHLTDMQPSTYKNYQLAGLPKDRVKEMDKLHRKVRDGRKINFWRKIFFKYRGKRVCGIAINDQNKLVSFNFLYFREEEMKDGIIHDAFLGVDSEERGQGIATALQKYTFDQLAGQGINAALGIVSKTNLGSIKMCQRVGFDIMDDPQDPENHLIVLYSLKNKK